MSNKIHWLGLAFFAMACGAGEITTTPPVTPKPCIINNVTASPQVVSMGGNATLSWSASANCSVTISYGSTTLAVTGTSAPITNITTTLTITVRGNGDSGTIPAVATATITAVSPPSLTIDPATPTQVTLTQSMLLKGVAKNAGPCTFTIAQWYTVNKEAPLAEKPKFTSDAANCTATFSPGSTMPCATPTCDTNKALWGADRVAVLQISSTGLDGSTVVAKHTVKLLSPKLLVDSVSPPKLLYNKCQPVRMHSSAGTFTATNGVDWRGTLIGFTSDTAKMITNLDQFLAPNLIGTGMCVVNFTERVPEYIANTGRPEAPLLFYFEIVGGPSSSISVTPNLAAPAEMRENKLVPLSYFRP